MTKRHRMESRRAPATLEEQSPLTDGILEHLKAAKIPVASKAFLLTEKWQASLAPGNLGSIPEHVQWHPFSSKWAPGSKNYPARLLDKTLTR